MNRQIQFFFIGQLMVVFLFDKHLNFLRTCCGIRMFLLNHVIEMIIVVVVMRTAEHTLGEELQMCDKAKITEESSSNSILK